MSIFQIKSKSKKSSKELSKKIYHITGKKPKNIHLYSLAFNHSSITKSEKDSNERLEYLGDAVLGTIVADYLFKKYPYKNEGFLTEIRSKIVNRESLNSIGRKIGLDKLVKFHQNKNTPHSHKSIYGNALEALVGAFYLDHGYKACQKFTQRKLLIAHIDMENTIASITNFKSALIEWAQKENKEIRFEIVSEIGSNHNKEFTSQVFLDNIPMESGTGFSKKKAEQSAAEKTHEVLKIG